MPWEALCFEFEVSSSKYGPVTTDPFGVRLQSLSHPVRRIGMWQIYGWGKTRALCKTRWIFRRSLAEMKA